MSLALQRILSANHGVITRRQALDAGLAPTRITEAVRRGQLVVVRRGVYADGDLWGDLDEYRGRPRLRTRAAILQLQREWVLSHDSAALEMGMPLLRPQESLVHITRPGYTSAWTRAGVKHHYARFAGSQVCEADDGFRHLSAARTAVDIAREHGETAGIAACDWALRSGVSRAQLIEAYLPMSYYPNVTTVRSCVDEADARAESVAETLGRILIKELGIGDVDVQFPLLVDGRVVWADLRVGNHIIEVHGKVKVIPTDRGGVASRPPEDIVWDDKLRARTIRAEDLGLSELFYEDFWGARREQAKKRILAENDVTVRRFGPDLHPHLAHQAAEIRDRLGWRDRLRDRPA